MYFTVHFKCTQLIVVISSDVNLKLFSADSRLGRMCREFATGAVQLNKAVHTVHTDALIPDLGVWCEMSSLLKC